MQNPLIVSLLFFVLWVPGVAIIEALASDHATRSGGVMLLTIVLGLGLVTWMCSETPERHS